MKKTISLTLMTLLLCVCMVFGLTACGGFTQDDIDNAVNSATADLNAEIAELEDEVETLEAEKKALESEKGELEAENEALESEKSELEAENEALESEKSELEKENETLKNCVKGNHSGTLSYTSNNDGTHYGTYSCCGAVADEAEAHNGTVSYTPNANDSTKHDVSHSCCDGSYSVTHTMNSATGKCDDCGLDMAKASLTSGETVTYYETLAEAVNAAQTADGSTVQLLDSVTLSNTIEINAGQFTIDLNGKKVTFENDVAFSITQGPRATEGANVTITSTVSGGEIEAGLCVMVESICTVKVTGVTLHCMQSSGAAAMSTGTGGTLTLENVTVTSEHGGVDASVGSSNVTILGNSSISGAKYDVACNTYSTITLGEGVTFPDGLTAYSDSGYKALNTMLADGMAYWQGDNKMIQLTSDTYEITGGTVTVKAVCTHEGGTQTYAPIEGGTQHTATYSCCGATVTEAHSGGTATCLVGKICEICGFEYEATNPNNHASDELTYTANEDETHSAVYSCCNALVYNYDKGTNTYTVYSPVGLLAWGEAARAVISTGTEDTNDDWYAEYTTDMPNLTLAADITLTGENNWTPLGYRVEGNSKYTYYPYIGTIDGNGHTITGLNINITGDCIAFVGSLGPNSEVKNLTFKDATIIGGERVATVAADCGGNVTNCHVTGSSSVSGNNQVAGVIAVNTDGIISGCTNAAAVTVKIGNDTYGSGGVVGSNFNGIVMGCFNSGDITGSGSDNSLICGGVVGCNYNYSSSLIIACGNTGNVVSSVGRVGGIAGGNYGVPVYACWTKETTELKSGTEESNKDGVGADNNNTSVLKACYSFANASAVADAITAMNTAIDGYNASAAEGRKCTYKWQVGTDDYPTLVEIDQTPTE